MYDFILFENIYSLENHYVDLGNLAYLLKKSGYRVALANVFKEEKLVKEKDIDIISLKYHFPSFIKKKAKHNGAVTFLYRFLSSLYLIYVICALKKKSNNFYIGSLTLGTPITWLLFLSSSKTYFIWGLRCHMLELWKKSHSLYGIYSKCLFFIVKRRNNLKLIVSHPIIKEEFISRLGINSDRIIYRPERFTRGESKLTYSSKKESFTLLTIGTLRRSKHVELILDALREINDPSIKYIIAGRCKNDQDYENMLQERSKGVPGIDRRNRFIPDEEYEQLMHECDYMVLCDQKEDSCATNGTMAEALLHGMPIIAPNHNPFKYEVEANGLGLLYEINSIANIKETLLKAKTVSREQYLDNLIKYSIQNSDKEVVSQLKDQLNNVLVK